uniref:Uncharacterized protein n=1 Tax=Heterorhabditis bacteriophora TaxID=37862 RepID=A0A1I7W8K6_HETBA
MNEEKKKMSLSHRDIAQEFVVYIYIYIYMIERISNEHEASRRGWYVCLLCMISQICVKFTFYL